MAPKALWQQTWLRRGLYTSLAGLALVSGLALWSTLATEELRAVQQLPEVERQALYRQTLRTLEVSCVGLTERSGLYEYCHGQAEFIRQFPECDSACQAIAKPYDRRPTR